MHNAAALEELGRIDFLLDQLARAVERGEVPVESYDRMAPRYLARRAELVALLWENESPALPGPQGRGTAISAPVVVRDSAPLFPEEDWSAPAPARAPRRAPKPVQWTTVLLFLGAFLVIVASAIFTFAVWDLLPVIGKFGFLTAVTAGFYVGGWWSHVRLKLRSGAVALTAVASALLLFDGWVLIEGYDLSGALPWAALLFICSLAYWFTETRLSERFFGVIGAASQVAWWWLLGQGLGWPAPARLAGLAVIAVLWQLAGARGRDDEATGSLARVLEWAAPVLTLLVQLGLLFDLGLVHSAGPREVGYAGIAALAACAVAWRSRLVPVDAGRWAGAALQVPFFAFAWTAAVTTGHTWWLVVAFALAALVGDVLALTVAGAPFAVVGLVAELSLVLEACALFDASAAFTVAAVALLGAAWASVPRMLRSPRLNPSETGAAPRTLAETALAAEWGSLAVLVGASIAVPFVQDGVALAGAPIGSHEAALAVAVGVAWLAASVAGTRMWQWLPAAAFSFYAAASVLAWRLPEAAPGVYGIGLLLVTAAWLFSSAAFERTRTDRLGEVVRWLSRAAAVGVAVNAVVIEVIRPWDVPPRPPAGLSSPLVAAVLALTALLFAIDARVFRSRVAAGIATAFAIVAARFAAGALPGVVLADRLELARDVARWGRAPAAGFAAVVCAALAGWWARRGSAPQPRTGSVRTFVPDLAPTLGRWHVVALTAASAGTLAVLRDFDPVSSAGITVSGLLLVTVAWLLASEAVSPWLVVAAGACLVGAAYDALAGFAGPPWVTVLVLTAVGATLSAPSFVGTPRSARRRAIVDALALSGVAAHVTTVLMSLDSVTSANVQLRPAWDQLGAQGLVLGLLVLAVSVIAHSARRDLEPGYYVGFGLVVLAIWREFGALEATQGELYSTPLALYLVGCGNLFAHIRSDRRYPVATDIGAAAVGLGYPLALALQAGSPSDMLVHTAWVVGLSLVAIGAGVAVKSRWFLFGGAAALSAVALYRSFTVLAEVWWLVLGLIGIALVVVALTWERQRMIVSETRERLKRSFEGWR